MAGNFSCLIATEGLLKVTGSRVYCKCDDGNGEIRDNVEAFLVFKKRKRPNGYPVFHGGWVTLTLIPPVTRLTCIVWVLSLFLGSIDARTWRGYRLYGPRPQDGPHWQFQSGDGAAVCISRRVVKSFRTPDRPCTWHSAVVSADVTIVDVVDGRPSSVTLQLHGKPPSTNRSTLVPLSGTVHWSTTPQNSSHVDDFQRIPRSHVPVRGVRTCKNSGPQSDSKFQQNWRPQFRFTRWSYNSPHYVNGYAL